jgi:hypothetical protein
MMNSEVETGRRRETSGAVLISRAARQLVAPAQQKLGIWQAEAVKLEAMVHRLRASGRNDAGLAEATRTLLVIVQRQAELLDAAKAEVPAAVREHSRVGDTVKVLRLLTMRLHKMLADLGEAAGKPR